MRHEHYSDLVNKILALFPNEVMGTYYLAPISKSDSPSGKSIIARGKLVNCVRNILHLSGDTRKRKTRKRPTEAYMEEDEETQIKLQSKISL